MTTSSFIIHKSWASLHLSFDFFTPQIGVLHELLQGINCPCFFKFSMIGFNTSLTSDSRGYYFWCGNMCGSLSLTSPGITFCVQPSFYISPYSRIYILFNQWERKRIFMKTEACSLLSIYLPKRGEGDSGMIRNSCENSTESQLQLRGKLQQ